MTLFCTRRGLGVLGVSLAGAGLQVLGQPRSVVHAPALPCANRPGDIVGLLLEGSGAPAGTVVVFGQVFRRGDLPRETVLAARLTDGRPLPVQADITTRHDDGSALFAVVSLAAPELARGVKQGVVLTRGAATAAVPLDALAAAAGRSAVIELTSGGSGAGWRADLLMRALEVLAQRPPRAVWQYGPLAVQTRVQAEVPATAVGNVASARLVADVALHADGTLWVDAWLRNDIAMQQGGGAAQYTMRLLLDGREALKTEPIRQLQYTGFGRLRGAARGGAAAPEQPYVRHDVAYLAETGAIAPYDLSTGVSEAVLAQLAQRMVQPEWSVPLAPRGIYQAMGSAGGRPDIGPTTRWQAAWLISGDRRAAEFSLGWAEADGAIPWHFWDPKGGADGSGGWLDTHRWPGFWTDPRAGQPPRTLTQPMSRETGWTPVRTHQPDLSFVPYLLTGRRAFLDGLLSQGVWGIISHWFAHRLQVGRTPEVRDLNLVYGNETRGAAWSMRQLDNAAWIAPDDDPNRAYLLTAARSNWAWIRGEIPAWTQLQGEAHGIIPGQYTRGALPPWQQDFFASSAASAARRGNEDARAVLRWCSNFLVGRFLAEARGFPPRQGIAYNLAIAPLPPAGVPLGNPWDYNMRNQYRTWREINDNTHARNWQVSATWERGSGYYGPLAQMSLALIIAVLDSAEAKRAFELVLPMGMPYTDVAAHQQDPTFNIVPPGFARVRGQLARCR